MLLPTDGMFELDLKISLQLRLRSFGIRKALMPTLAYFP
jgi:hypothetical protein